MKRESAGILLYKFGAGGLKVLLVHPGGPYWAKKDDGAWSIPKGEIEAGEDPEHAALREAGEELGVTLKGNMSKLTPVKQHSGKIIHAWAMEGEFDPASLLSNTFEIEWPPHSGIMSAFPEIDRAEWFEVKEAEKKIDAGQLPFLRELSSIKNF